MDTNNSIQVPKEHIPHIKEYYTTRRKQLLTELSEIDAFLMQIDPAGVPKPILLNGQGILLNQPPITDGGYNPRWSLIKKAKFAIRNAGRPLTSKEIVDFIIGNYDPDLTARRKTFMASMSGTLSNKSKAGGIFTRAQNDADEYEYDVRK